MNKKNVSEPPREVTSSTAKKWYDLGFRFAINYLHAIMPESSDESFDKETFKNFLDDVLNQGVEDDYFEKHPFNDPSNYPPGMCPGDRLGTCIQCADRAITPLGKKTKKA